MKKPSLALIVAVALVAIPGTATAAEGDPSASCTPLKEMYAPKNWRDATPKNGQIVCRGPSRRGAQNTVRHFRDYRLYRESAPFHGPSGYGPPRPDDRRWWAIPWYIVCGESGGDFYVNDDGAYQIIPSTWAAYGGLRFAGTAGSASPLAQHIIAARAWGNTPWYGAC